MYREHSDVTPVILNKGTYHEDFIIGQRDLTGT